MNNIQMRSLQESTVFNLQKKSNQKKTNVSSRRKLLISPSKDFLVFFNEANFNKFNPVKYDTKEKKNTKLTLNRKQNNKQKNTTQKSVPQQQKKFKKVLSITNSTESFTSNKKSLIDDQKFFKLKKQVDQIRRKYSYGKLKQSTNLCKVNSEQLLKNSISCQSACSLNSSKDKISFLTPKNDRYLGKKILTRNIFSQKSNRLRLTSNNRVDSVETIQRLKANQKRKNSFEFENQIQQIDIKSQIQGFDPKKTFQFTFGSMAMMDFRNKQKLKIMQKTQK